jgi:CheY-like chemotaxis protein
MRQLTHPRSHPPFVMPLTSILRSGSAKKRKTPCASSGAQSSNRRTMVMITDREGLYLPRARDARILPQVAAPVESDRGGCETLLLAEDEPAVRLSTREFLCLKGYIVLEAKNGTDALAVARDYKGQIDLMITDVVMPQMGGARLAGELATECPAMRVLFVSGYAQTTVQGHGAIDVTSRFLQKPFSLKTLAHKVREILDTEVLALAAAAASV